MRLTCKRVTRTVSLYLGGDLTLNAQREVAEHLTTCESCRGLVEAFSESTSLLAEACAGPELDAEFYSEIRLAVLSQISRDRGPLNSLFTRRLIYATAVAAILILSGVGLQYFHPVSSGEPPLDFADTRQVSKEIGSTREANYPKAVRSQSGAHVSRRLANTRGLSMKRPARKQEPFVISPTSSSDGGKSEISRIEIQTANPNIRIIWFTMKNPGEIQEANQTKDENRDRE